MIIILGFLVLLISILVVADVYTAAEKTREREIEKRKAKFFNK